MRANLPHVFLSIFYDRRSTRPTLEGFSKKWKMLVIHRSRLGARTPLQIDVLEKK